MNQTMIAIGWWMIVFFGCWWIYPIYPLVIHHSNGKSPINGGVHENVIYKWGNVRCYIWWPEGNLSFRWVPSYLKASGVLVPIARYVAWDVYHFNSLGDACGSEHNMFLVWAMFPWFSIWTYGNIIVQTFPNTIWSSTVPCWIPQGPPDSLGSTT